MKVDDKYNPDLILACTHTEMLKAIAAGEVNMVDLAKRELLKRNPELIEETINNFIFGSHNLDEQPGSCSSFKNQL